MSLELRILTAPDRPSLECLVQLAIGQGWRRVGTPAEVTYNGTMEKRKFQQAMRRM